MREHWMAIPIAAVSPFLVAAFVLSKTEHWSNGAQGAVILGLLSIAAIVGSFMMPIERGTGNRNGKDDRPGRSG
jgi:hypothetical protein